MTWISSSNPNWDDARSLAYAHGEPLDTRSISLKLAIGYVLADDVHALSDLPPAHTAMMDGYAVRGQQPWTIVGEVHAGDHVTHIEDGTALLVSTGAHIPAETEMVIPSEDADELAGSVTGELRNPNRNNVRPPGDEAIAGDIVAQAGTRITPVVAGLIASAGHDTVEVYRRPIIDVLVTGSELISAGPSQPGSIRDSLSIQIPAWAEYLGCDIHRVQVLPDELGPIIEFLYSSKADIVITTGGTAHGPRDMIRPALLDLRGEYVIDQVQSKPGHPMLLAKIPDGPFVANLPGNPLAAVVGFMTMVSPLVESLTGRNLSTLDELSFDHDIDPDVTRIVPVNYINGEWTPTEFRGSAMLRGLAHAECFAVLAPYTSQVRRLNLPWN